MANAFELTSNFNAKLESDSSKKVDRALGYDAFASSSGFIEYLIIQLMNITTQAEYSESASIDHVVKILKGITKPY